MKTSFHDYFFGLPVSKRADFAKKIGSSRAYLTAVAGGFKHPSVEMAAKIICAANKKTTVNLKSGNTTYVMSATGSTAFTVTPVEPGNDQ